MRRVVDFVNGICDFFRGLENECTIQKKNHANESIITENRSEACCSASVVEKPGFYVPPTDHNEQQPVYYGYHDDKPDRWGHS